MRSEELCHSKREYKESIIVLFCFQDDINSIFLLLWYYWKFFTEKVRVSEALVELSID